MPLEKRIRALRYIWWLPLNWKFSWNQNDAWIENAKTELSPLVAQSNKRFSKENYFEEDVRIVSGTYSHFCNKSLCECAINSTIYLRGIYRKIFFNLAEFLVRIWPLVLLLGMMRDRRRTETSSRKQRHSLRQRHFYVEHGARPRARAKCHFSHKYFSRLWLSQWTLGPDFGLTNPNQYPKVPLVGPKSSERNKIACRFIKLWNNLINRPRAKLTNQLSTLVGQTLHLVGCTHHTSSKWLFVCLAFVCSAAALWSCSQKNKHQKKQQRHARAEERIQILNLLFHRKKEFTIWIRFLGQFKICGLSSTFF